MFRKIIHAVSVFQSPSVCAHFQIIRQPRRQFLDTVKKSLFWIPGLYVSHGAQNVIRRRIYWKRDFSFTASCHLFTHPQVH